MTEILRYPSEIKTGISLSEVKMTSLYQQKYQLVSHNEKESPSKNRSISSFKGEDFFEIDQSETRIARGGHVCKPIGTK
jgi:hypothetical protein